MSKGDTDKVDPVAGAPSGEAVEQQELRKKIADSVHEAQAKRSGEQVAEARPEEPAPPVKEWTPPEEAGMTAETGRLLVRLVVFAILVFGVYMLVQQIISSGYAPELRAAGFVIPEDRVMPETPTRLGILARNEGRMDGAAFVVAALAGGEEVEGPEVTIPGGDTATVWVDVSFPAGDQVFALVLFDGWREVERVTTYPGLSVRVGEHFVEMSEVLVPETVSVGDTMTIGLSASNTGEYPEEVRAVVLLSSRTGERPVQFQGDVVEIAPGESTDLEIAVDTGSLPPGRYTADVLIVTAARGRKITGVETPIPVEVTE